MSPADPILSIDYGTSNTVAVLRGPDDRSDPLLFDGSPLLASSVWLDSTGDLLTGRDAQHSARLDPARFEPNPKRRIDEETLLLGTTEVPVVDAVSATLARVADEATRTAGTLPGRLTMTHPATWGGLRRQVLLDAAAKAGLPVPELVAEPVAAAMYYAEVLHSPVQVGGHLVVYDLGAGTLDVAIVARTASGWDIVAVDGLDDLGGLDIDAMILDCIAAGLPPTDTAAWAQLMQPRTPEQRRAARTLWQDATFAKELLSRASSTQIHIPLLDRDTHITRSELEAAARPRLVEAAQLTRRLLAGAGVIGPFGTGLFLVGGSSRIPLVGTTLLEATRIAPTVLDRPETVVATGALIDADTARPAAANSATTQRHTGAPAVPPAAKTATATASRTVEKPPASTPAPRSTGTSGAGHGHAPLRWPSSTDDAAPVPSRVPEGRFWARPAEIERPSAKRRAALITAAIAGGAAFVLAFYLLGAFTSAGPYRVTPDACALITAASSVNHDFPEAIPEPGGSGSTSTCEVRAADGAASFKVTVERFGNRLRQPATDVARQTIRSRLAAVTRYQHVEMNDSWCAQASHGREAYAYFALDDEAETQSAVCWLGTNLIVTGRLTQSQAPTAYYMPDVLKQLPTASAANRG